MRLAVQIFRKDAARLRWPVALTLALVAYWAFRDATLPWGSSPQVMSPGAYNWLNLALPFAWAVLIALVIHEDPLAGDRQFWVALPCGWKPLIIAKAMFVAAFIHLPYFIATVIILMARDFNPVAHLPHLLWKQILLLALTIPALGAATLVKNVAHFLLLAIVLASAVVLRVRDFNVIDSQVWVWDIRWNLALILVACGAIGVVTMQFIRRSTRTSRIVGILIAIAAACLYSWIPRNATAAISAAFSPAKDHVTVRLAGDGPAQSSTSWNYQLTIVSLPLALDGAIGLTKDADLVSLEIVTAAGARYPATPAKNFIASTREPVLAIVPSAGPGRLLRADLYFTSPRVWDGVRSGKVTLRGRMIVEYARAGGAEIHCQRRVTSLFPKTSSFGSVECESVELGGRNVRRSSRGLVEHQYTASHFPADPWLSPIHRSRALYANSGPSIPAKLYEPLGFEIVDYTIPNLDLNQFVVRTR